MQDNELEDLYFTTMVSLRGPHDLESPIDPFIDRDGDEFVSQQEIELFAHSIFVLPVFNLFERMPHIAWIADSNENGQIDEEEAGQLLNFMFEEEPEFVQTGPVDHLIEEAFDSNKDGYFEKAEFDEGKVLLLINFVIFADLDEERVEVHTFLDELSDVNNDGFLDQREIELRKVSLSEPHEVENPFDERLDFNRNGIVDQFEINEALEMDQQEISAASFLPVETQIDTILDLNSDGIVTDDEIMEILNSFMMGEGPVDDDRVFSQFFDLEKDGFVTESDLYIFRELIFRPHPVMFNSDFDISLDVNKDDFVSPEEIGIAAGFSPEASILNFDERLERMSWSEPDEIFPLAEKDKEEKPQDSTISVNSRVDRSQAAIKKLEQITGKSLAVVNINIATSNVNDETAAGIILFIENAFVNLGYASVMDRANLDSVLKEQKFEMSSIIDEETALEAGKIAGLDFVIVGSISYVGEKYYLNVKCLNVETSEIFGSSIAEADDQKGFYEMSNIAVGKFF